MILCSVAMHIHSTSLSAKYTLRLVVGADIMYKNHQEQDNVEIIPQVTAFHETLSLYKF